MSYNEEASASDGQRPAVDVNAIAETLDPDLKSAVEQGNAAVIAAIKGGARTTAEVVDRMIQLGFLTGLPPEVQKMVDTRMDEMEKQREADNKALLGTAAAVGSAALLAGWGDRNQDAGTSDAKSAENKSALDPAILAMGMDLIHQMADYGTMTAQQKDAYLQTVATISRSKWDGLSTPEKAKTVDNVAEALHQEIAKTPENREQLLHTMQANELYGKDAAERQRTVEHIEANQKTALQEAMQAHGLTEEALKNLGIKEREALFKDADARFEAKNGSDFGQNQAVVDAANTQGRQLMGNEKRNYDLAYLSQNQDKIKSKDSEVLALYETYTTTKDGAAGAAASAHDNKESLKITKEVNDNTQKFKQGETIKAEAGARGMDRSGTVSNLGRSYESAQAQTGRDNLTAGADSFYATADTPATNTPRPPSIDATPLLQSPLASLGADPESPASAGPNQLPTPLQRQSQPTQQRPGANA